MAKNARSVLIVDDDISMRRFLRNGYELAGYEVRDAASADDAIKSATLKAPDLIVLDLGLGDRDGREFLEQIRGWSNVPVIILSGRSDEEEKVQLLQSGADDYVTKPFGMSELLARSEAALRRYFTSTVQSPTVTIGPLKIELATRKVHVNQVRVSLSRKEYRLLELLATRTGAVFTHQQLLKEIWGTGYVHNIQYLRILARKLRQKIEADPTQPVLVLSESGVGYRLASETDLLSK
jgi:two-component system KDP operon response regulator KdpE